MGHTNFPDSYNVILDNPFHAVKGVSRTSMNIWLLSSAHVTRLVQLIGIAFKFGYCNVLHDTLQQYRTSYATCSLGCCVVYVCMADAITVATYLSLLWCTYVRTAFYYPPTFLIQSIYRN